MDKQAFDALKAFVAWCEIQLHRNKHNLISQKDFELFASRFKVEPGLMKQQYEHLGVAEKCVYQKYLMDQNQQYE